MSYSDHDRAFRWERIAGFVDVKAFYSYQRCVDEAVAAGAAKEVEVDSNYGRAMIYGGRWFEDPLTGEVWRLVEPQPPFMGLWERVLGYSVTTRSESKPAARPRSESRSDLDPRLPLLDPDASKSH